MRQWLTPRRGQGPGRMSSVLFMSCIHKAKFHPLAASLSIENRDCNLALRMCDTKKEDRSHDFGSWTGSEWQCQEDCWGDGICENRGEGGEDK